MGKSAGRKLSWAFVERRDGTGGGRGALHSSSKPLTWPKLRYRCRSIDAGSETDVLSISNSPMSVECLNQAVGSGTQFKRSRSTNQSGPQC
jgi:hypothetical protein